MILKSMFHLAALGSTILCMFVVVLWSRSQRVVDELEFGLEGREFYVYSFDEGLSLIAISGSGYPIEPAWYSRLAREQLDLIRRARKCRLYDIGRFGFRYTLGWCVNPDDGMRSVMIYRTLHMPHAAMALALSILPFVWLTRAIRRRRARCDRILRGLCLACGYDLRFSPTRCPECGLARAEGIRYDGPAGFVAGAAPP